MFAVFELEVICLVARFAWFLGLRSPQRALDGRQLVLEVDVGLVSPRVAWEAHKPLSGLVDALQQPCPARFEERLAWLRVAEVVAWVVDWAGHRREPVLR